MHVTSFGVRGMPTAMHSQCHTRHMECWSAHVMPSVLKVCWNALQTEDSYCCQHDREHFTASFMHP